MRTEDEIRHEFVRQLPRIAVVEHALGKHLPIREPLSLAEMRSVAVTVRNIESKHQQMGPTPLPEDEVQQGYLAGWIQALVWVLDDDVAEKRPRHRTSLRNEI